MGNGTYERGTASLFRLAANKDLLMFGCHHDTVWLRRGPQSSRPGQSVPPRQPGLSPATTVQVIRYLLSFKEFKKGVLKYQYASRDHGKQLLKLLLLPEHVSFLEGEGPSTQQREKLPLLPPPNPLEKSIPAYPQTLQRLP